MMCAGHSFWGRKAEDGPGPPVLPPPPLGHAGRVHQRRQCGRGGEDISGEAHWQGHPEIGKILAIGQGMDCRNHLILIL